MSKLERRTSIGTECRSCGNSESKSLFFNNDDTPADCGYLPLTKQAAFECAIGPIKLSLCRHCGLIQNESFDRSKINFVPGYEVSLEHSPTFLAFQNEVSNRLVDKFNLRGKTIIEIGCGNGLFLSKLCTQGKNVGIGIDPTAPEKSVSGNVTYIQDFFASNYTDLDCDFICSLSVLEDVSSIHEFLSSVHQLALKNDASVYFEVFNGWRTFSEREVWSVHYEQCNYFSSLSLGNAIRQAGFKVVEQGTCYGEDQYLYIEAKPSHVGEEVVRPNREDLGLVFDFSDTFQSRKTCWEETLRSTTHDRIVLWGLGGKGISFLNSIEGTERISAVVDINPGRQGHYVPGTAHRIICPESLVEMRPGMVIISNAIYAAEISKLLSQLGLNPEITIA